MPAKTTQSPAKTTPAPVKTAAAAKPKVTFDFGAMEVADVQASEVKHTRNSQLDSSPVMEWLKQSKQNNVGKAVGMPDKAHAEAFITLLRSAAARLGIGVRILVEPTLDKGTDTEPRKVTFIGKDKRNRKPKATAQSAQ